MIIKNLVYFYVLIYCNLKPSLIYRSWKDDVILKEYEWPEFIELAKWLREFKREVEYA